VATDVISAGSAVAGWRFESRKAKQPTTSTDESINDERVKSAQPTKSPQILPGATLDQLMSDWKHDEDQQNEIVFHVFPEHHPQKRFQQFAAKQSLFAVWHDRKENQKSILILITAAHVKKELNHSIGDKSSSVGPCSRFHDC